MATPLLALRGVTKRFGETVALDKVDATILPGRVQTVLGENGSGKSTIAKVMAGIIEADTAEIMLEGRRITKPTTAKMIENGVVIVLQEVLIAPNRTVTENVFLGHDGLFQFSASSSKKREIAKSILSRLTAREIDVDALAGEITLQEQQIVVIARGFARNPKLLILDEATAALDLQDRTRFFDAIRAFCQDGGAVVFVSHRMPEIIEISDSVLVLQNGRAVADLSGSDINVDTILQHLTREAQRD